MFQGLTIILFAILAAGTDALKIPLDDDYHGSRSIRSVDTVGEDNYRCISQETYDDVFPGQCRKYYHCSGGELSEGHCFILKRFDPVTLACRWFFLVKCDSDTITTVSPEPTNPTLHTANPTRSPGPTGGPSTGLHTAATRSGDSTETPTPTIKSGASQICGMLSIVLMLTSVVLILFRY